METKFKPGDIVKVSSPCDGRVGVILDTYLNASGKALHTVRLDAESIKLVKIFGEDELEAVADKATYRYEFDFLDYVVVAILYEKRGDTELEIGRGHGHIIHRGAQGVAQAASYALKRIYMDLYEEDLDERQD